MKNGTASERLAELSVAEKLWLYPIHWDRRF